MSETDADSSLPDESVDGFDDARAPGAGVGDLVRRHSRAALRVARAAAPRRARALTPGAGRSAPHAPQLRGAAAHTVTWAAGVLLLAPLLLVAATFAFLLLRWAVAPPRHAPPHAPCAFARAPRLRRRRGSRAPPRRGRSHVSAVRPLHFDFTQAAPTAVAAFLPRRYLLNGALAPGTPPLARFLPPGQPFDLVLRLARARARACGGGSGARGPHAWARAAPLRVRNRPLTRLRGRRSCLSRRRTRRWARSKCARRC
jgi:hypothetical protein